MSWEDIKERNKKKKETDNSKSSSWEKIKERNESKKETKYPAIASLPSSKLMIASDNAKHISTATTGERVLARTKKNNEDKKDANEGTWFSAGDFSDDYQFGDITKSTLGTVGDVGLNVAKGVSYLGEGLGDLLGYGAAGIVDLVGYDDTAEIMRNNLQKSQTDETFKSADDFIDQHSFLGEKGDSVAQGLGYIAPIMATGGVLGAAGVSSTAISAGTSALIGSSSMGSGMSEAYQGGATDEEALMYGVISGVTAAGTELIFGGLGKATKALGFSKGLLSLDDALAVKLQRKISSELGKNLVGYGIKAGAEGTEEVIEGLVNAIGKKMTYMSDEDLVKIIEDENLLDQFISGSIISGIAQTPSLVKTTSASNNIKTDYTQSNQEAINNEIENNVSNLQQNSSNNQTNLQKQQIAQVENNMSQNQNMEQIDDTLPITNEKNIYEAKEQLRIDSENFAKQVEAVENGTFPSEDMLTLGSTPKILQELGMKNLPITMTQKHLETISKKSGKYTNSNYHNLGIDTVKQLPEAIANPLNVLKSHNNSYVIITSLADKQGQIVIASIRIDGKGIVNNIQIDSNVLTSAYGRKNYDDYMRKNIEAGNLIYDIDEGIIKENLNITNNPRLQLPNDISNSVPNNIISQNEQNMQVQLQDNIDTYNYMQNSENNAQNIKKQQAPSISNNYAETSNKPNSWSNQQINNIENNQETLYNNNESESDIDENSRRIEQDDKRRVQELFKSYERGQTDGTTDSQELRGNQIQKTRQGVDVNEQIQQRGMLESNNRLSRVLEEKGNQETREYTRKEYEQWEQSIEPITYSKLTNEQRELKSNVKRQYGKDIVFFDGKNNQNGYSAGASYNDSSRINIDINQAQEFGINKLTYHETMESDILHNQQIRENVIEPVLQKIIEDPNFEKQKSIFWQNQEGKVPNDYLIAKELLCDRFAEIKTGEQWDYENVLSQETNMTIDFAIENFENSLNNNKLETVKTQQAPSIANNILETGEYTKRKKLLNPTEISQIKKEDSSATPKLKNKTYAKGNKISSFYQNITETSQFLNEDFRKTMENEENIKYYKGITNEKTLEKAFDSLKEDGSNATVTWATKDSKNATAEDVAKGWILLKQYQDSGDYQSAVEVAKKMRDIGTSAGQTVQAYNILSRLTPEGMFYYAQSELSEAYNKMVEGKSKKWIEENQSKFDLTPEDTQFIMDTMQDVSTMEDGYNKKVKLAEIQKLITDKIPSTAGQSIKAWMRISMLFNPKTQVRNVAGNATILPVNMFSDSVSAGIDKLISKKTGVRTTGNINLKSYGKGFGKGLYESYNDFKKGINTRNIQENRFEVSEGRSFNNKGIGKALNRVDSLLSFMLDAGDRGFYEATFTNSINNQLVLNNTTEVTQDMIDIATNEALQRTWQDNNKYTQIVLTIRNALNGKVGKSKGLSYGLGDILIPFAKTPANLTKAIVDYSPAGLVNTITSGIKLKNSLETGQYTAKLQHQFAQNLGKATAGTFLYVLGYALAKAGIATGEADDDKDIKNFMQNSLGISSYSIKIGDKTFTYDWMQPIAAPLSIMTNVVKSEEKGKALLEGVIGNLDTAGSILLEQSFLQTINKVLSDSDGVVSGLINQALELPARAIPTFSKQIADMVDGTQRTSFEYGEPVQSAINSVVAKIPFASKTLAPSVDTLGNEIQKYGGDNNIFNVFLNPANTNKGKLSKAGQEIYNVYTQTGDATIFPRTAPYYIDNKGEKVTMSSTQRSEFQKVSGQYVEKNLESIMNTSTYKKLSDDRKAEVINEIVSDSYSEAKDKILNISSEDYEKEKKKREGISNKTYYDYKIKTEDLKKDNEKIKVLVTASYSNKEKTALYENYVLDSSDETYPLIKQFFTDKGLNINKYLEYKTQGFKSDVKDDGTVDGATVGGSKKEKVYDYVNNMKISYTQRLLLLGTQYKLEQNQRTTLANYINSSSLKPEEKLELFGKIKGFTVYKDGTVEW